VSRARIHVAVALSVLVHALVAAIPASRREGAPGLVPSPTSLVVRLVEARAPEAVPPPVSELVPPPPRLRPRTEKPAPVPRPVAPAEPVPVEAPAPVERAERLPAPQFDMLAMINARRERREAFEDAMKRREEPRGVPGASNPNEAALAALNRNLQSLGSQGETTGGVFQILSKGTRTAEFAFNGFRPGTGRRWREVIEVDAGPGGDVDLAIVRRMIQLIRTHYSGDFVWKSPRLGRSLVLSARVEHTRELEDFLVREFFGTPTLGRAP
jgi:hypothetical protein